MRGRRYGPLSSLLMLEYLKVATWAEGKAMSATTTSSL